MEIDGVCKALAAIGRELASEDGAGWWNVYEWMYDNAPSEKYDVLIQDYTHSKIINETIAALDVDSYPSYASEYWLENFPPNEVRMYDKDINDVYKFVKISIFKKDE